MIIYVYIICIFYYLFTYIHTFFIYIHGDSTAKNLPAMKKTKDTWIQSLGQEDPLEEDKATNSSILPWRIPWTEEPGGPQSKGL